VSASIPVVIRWIGLCSKWFICYPKSYQNAFSSELNGFETRDQAVEFAESHGCVVERHHYDRLQQDDAPTYSIYS